MSNISLNILSQKSSDAIFKCFGGLPSRTVKYVMEVLGFFVALFKALVNFDIDLFIYFPGLENVMEDEENVLFIGRKR